MTDAQARQKSVDMFLASKPAAADAPMSAWRDGFEAMCAQLEIPADARIDSVAIAGVPCLKIQAAGASPDRLVVHFHSGGYVMGSAHGYRSFGARLSAATGATVLLPDYRLAPEHPYPAAAEDGLAVYRWCVESYAPSKFMLSGDSAGGGLCMATLMAARDEGLHMPCGAIGISPLLDLAGEGPSAVPGAVADPLIDRDLIVGMGKVYIGDLDPHQHPQASPLWGKHHNLPPLFLLVSETEALRDDVLRMEVSVRAAGGKVQVSRPTGLVHIWTIFPFLQASKDSLAEIGRFAETCFAAS